MSETRVTILRTSQWVNSGREYEIYLNGEPAARVSNGGRQSLEVEPGTHRVRIKLDHKKSKELSVTVAPGEDKELVCGSTLAGYRAWLALFYVIFPITDLYVVEYRDGMTLDLGERTYHEVVSKGMGYYLWREGVLGWGVPVGVFVFVVNAAFNYRTLSAQSLLRGLVSTMTIFAVAGVIFGLIMWRFVLRSGKTGE